MSQYNRNNKNKGESSKQRNNNKAQRPSKNRRIRGVLASSMVAEASSSKPRKLNDSRVVDRYAGIARQILSPATCPAKIEPTPNSCSRQVCPRRYVRVVDFEPPASGHFSVYMSPDLYVPGMITDGSVRVIPAVAGRLSLDARYISTDALEDQVHMEGKFYETDAPEDSTLARTQIITDGAGVSVAGFTYVTAADTSITLTNTTSATVVIQLWRIPTATGLWTLANTYTINKRSFISVTSATHVDAYALRFPIGGGLLAVGAIGMSLTTTVGQHTSDAGLSFAPAFGKKVGELDISEGRVISMSVKITNTSNALSRGGNISIGRVPSTFNPFTGISENMSRLPANRRYQDAAETGGYAFWLPEQGDEWEFDNIEKKKAAYSDANYLLAHVSGLPAGSSFRITFAWVVEFYTESENFPKVDCPVSTPLWLEVQKLLMMMDASCCNPESANIFKRFMDSGVRGLKSLKNHYYDNEDSYKQILELAKYLAGLTL